MTTPGARARDRPRRILGLAIAGAVGLTACSGAVAPAGDPSATPPASADQPGRSAPAGGVDPGSGTGGGPGSGTGGGLGGGTGGTGGNSGTGNGIGIGPVDPNPFDPAAGQPTIVRPNPGRANPHPVAPTRFETSIDGRHVLVRISWYGGVEPCSVLDSVRIERAANDIALTPFEGSSAAGDVACIDIAMLKATIVDLGELEPGSYRIASPAGGAAAVTFTID